jgi:hypothetical protein
MIKSVFGKSLRGQHLILGVFILLQSAAVFAEGAADPTRVERLPELEGYQVQFNYGGEYPKEREIAYRYYKENYSFDEWHPLEEGNIGIDVYDIKDGEKGIFTYLQNAGYCGSAGCRFHLLRRSSEPVIVNEKYDSIAQGQIYPSVKVLKTKALGYHDLLIEDKRGTYIWGWDGSVYKVKTEIEESDWGKGCSEDAWGNKRVEEKENN